MFNICLVIYEQISLEVLSNYFLQLKQLNQYNLSLDKAN